MAQELTAQEQEGLQKLNIFYAQTDKVKQEIEVILDEARKQGLRVSQAQEGRFPSYLGVGNYYEIGHYGTGWKEDKISHDYYAYHWTIDFQPNDATLDIYLGLKQTITNWPWPFGSSIRYTPANSAVNVEALIKEWLEKLLKAV